MVIDDTHTRTQAGARIDGYTLTVEDVADQIGKSVETVRRYIRTGKLAALKVEGKNTNEYRVNPDDLPAIDARTQSHTQSPARAGDRAVMGVSVETPALAAVLDELRQHRATMESLIRALDENTKAHTQANAHTQAHDRVTAHTQAHDRVTAPPPRPRSALGSLLVALARRLS